MKTTQLFGYLFATIISFSTLLSCKKKESVDPGTASVRLVNTVLSLNGQDLYQENVKRTEQAIEYGNHSSLLNVVAGYSVFWTGDESTKKRTSISDAVLQKNKQYTFFVYKMKNEATALAGYTNDTTKAGIGKYRIRFLNLCSDFNDVPLDVTDRNGDGISTGLNFGASPVYIELPATTEIRVHLRDRGEITAIPASEIQGGKTYFVWFDTNDNLHVKYHIITEN